MNAAIRAVVRLSLQLGMNIYWIKEGYHGLIEGDEYIVKVDWYDVSSILHKVRFQDHYFSIVFYLHGIL